MKIHTGLHDRMVLQRGKDNACDAAVTGEVSAAGEVRVSVTQDGKPVRGFADQAVGRATRSGLKARISGLKAGGPYDITLRVVDSQGVEHDSRTVKGVLVGDVWLLGGQSNMQGCGNHPDRHRGHPLVRGFYMDDRWAKAADPLHNMWAAVDEVHPRILGGPSPAPERIIKGVGPGVAFGVRMHELTGVPQGLIAAAHGGTSMDQWSPTLHERSGEPSTLFTAAIRRVIHNGGAIAGVVWYQGESDANELAVDRYADNMVELIAALRKALKCGPGGVLPVSIVQIGRVISQDWAVRARLWNSIQDQQRRLPSRIRGLSVTPAVDLELDDLIHISGRDQQTLGVRLADAMAALRADAKAARKSPPPAIELKSLSAQADPHTGDGVITVTFDHVVGGLTAPGRPVGFALESPAYDHSIFKITLDGSQVRLHTGMSVEALQGIGVHYGLGCDPACNIHDQAGRPLPVFGPVCLLADRAITPFVSILRVSAPQPSADVADLACPDSKSDLKLAPRQFAGRFCDLHGDYPAIADDNPLHYYAARFRCDQAMKLTLRLGYDGPVRVWLDRDRVLWTDAAGANPAVEDQATVNFNASAGEHELLIALSSNHKRAWGVFLRLERRDVTRKQIQQGPDAYVAPVFVEG